MVRHECEDGICEKVKVRDMATAAASAITKGSSRGTSCW